MREFENFDSWFIAGLEKGELSISLAKQKLFAQEFFNADDEWICAESPKTYDIKDNVSNDAFVHEAFTKGESVLPMHNLADIAFIFGKY